MLLQNAVTLTGIGKKASNIYKKNVTKCYYVTTTNPNSNIICY